VIEPILEARGLGRRRGEGEGWLLDNVSLSVRPGERLALVGPSGAGKTLLLRALARLDPIDQGEILWRGQVVRGESVPAYRSEVVYVHQRPALFEGTVEDNLRLPFSLKRHRARTFDRQKVVDLLAALGRDATFLDKGHRDLSGGESQIMALVRVIQLDPVVLLLDEPTAALDATAAAAVERLLEAWHSVEAGRRSLMWISHAPEQASRVSDRKLTMDSGKLAVETVE
jgi:putative ABC transport system ATP-binding protein